MKGHVPTSTSTSTSYDVHDVHPSLRGMKYVLFPRDPWVQRWDNFFLFVLVYYCFSIPYAVGVSGGYRMYQNNGWLVVNMVLNLFYLVDTIMQFFRAYYDKNGLLVYELRKIARNYFFSIKFVLDLIASCPMQLVVLLLERTYEDHETRPIHLLATTQLLKLLRVTRINGLAKSSIAIQTWWERQDVPRAMLAFFIFKLVMVSHCIACLWSFIAFIQARTFGPALGEEANWISNWYDSSYVEGGINPIGWQNDLDRYALSLFWAIQTITSIGYGNMVPVTRLEYYFANILMLGSGLFWAFVIGNLVSIVDHMNDELSQYKRHLDEANNLIGCFSPYSSDTSAAQPDIGVGDPGVIATRIRRFITCQSGGMVLNSPAAINSPTVDQIFPTLDSLSLELRRLASLHLVGKHLEMVPYLSHKYLTPEEQSEVAFKCAYMEFSIGESFTQHPKYGRGIMILRKGFCMSVRTTGGIGFTEMYNSDQPIAVNDVLVEDRILGNDKHLYRFVSYSVVVFIPRSVICAVLSANKRAWKECARWKYLQIWLLKWAREQKNA